MHAPSRSSANSSSSMLASRTRCRHSTSALDSGRAHGAAEGRLVARGQLQVIPRGAGEGRRGSRRQRSGCGGSALQEAARRLEGGRAHAESREQRARAIAPTPPAHTLPQL